MSYLLDTHVWIWSMESPAEVGPVARALLENPENPLFVSSISTLELARLQATGVIEPGGPLLAWIADAVEILGASTIEVSHEIAVEAYQLPGSFHSDPADRVLVATARIHELEMLTADRRILDYPHVKSLDVRR